jgi:hypothetical protein
MQKDERLERSRNNRPQRSVQQVSRLLAEGDFSRSASLISQTDREFPRRDIRSLATLSRMGQATAVRHAPRTCPTCLAWSKVWKHTSLAISQEGNTQPCAAGFRFPKLDLHPMIKGFRR